MKPMLVAVSPLAPARAPAPARADAAALAHRVLLLERAASIDALTGLWNRRHFGRVVAREIACAESQHVPLSLMLLAFDPPATGLVQAVQAAALLLAASSRPTDLLVRWSERAFGVLAPATTLEGASALAARLRGGLRAASAIPPVRASVGEHRAGEAPELWIARVEDALATASFAADRPVAQAPRAWEAWHPAPRESPLRVAWSENLRSGDPALDAQLGALLDAVNTLIAVMIDKPLREPEVLERLDGVLAALERHFADEEALLAKAGYPDLERHSRLHRRLSESSRRLRSAIFAGSATPGTVIDFLACEVIDRHFSRADREYFAYLAGR